MARVRSGSTAVSQSCYLEVSEEKLVSGCHARDVFYYFLPSLSKPLFHLLTSLLAPDVVM